MAPPRSSPTLCPARRRICRQYGLRCRCWISRGAPRRLAGTPRSCHRRASRPYRQCASHTGPPYHGALPGARLLPLRWRELQPRYTSCAARARGRHVAPCLPHQDRLPLVQSGRAGCLHALPQIVTFSINPTKQLSRAATPQGLPLSRGPHTTDEILGSRGALRSYERRAHGQAVAGI